MIEYFAQYGVFLAKVVTLVVAIVVIITAIAAAAGRVRQRSTEGELLVEQLNQKLADMALALKAAVLGKAAYRAEVKRQRKAEKAKEKQKPEQEAERKRVFVLHFNGDLRASQTDHLRREVTAILQLAQPGRDEVMIALESPGGMVHGYGLAASQIKRIKDKGILLTVCVDKVAASGGYMMACIADKILAAPFAVVGSIGVVAQLPNFNRLLKKHDIDIELHTAGEYKRTLTLFGENTEEGRRKFREELDDTHALFKEFVKENRPSVDIDQVATGEHWYGARALEHGLIDGLQTSDDYLLSLIENADVYSVKYVRRHKLGERLGLGSEEMLDRLLMRWWARLRQPMN